MKRLLALTLALMMVLSLAACGGSSAPAATQAPAEAPAEAPAAEAPAAEAPAAEDGVVPRPDGYPSKSTITWVVPSSAGGSLDGYTRALADLVDLGGNIVVENISGGSYTIGMTEVALNDPDGTTICTTATTGLISSPLTMEGLAYSQDSFRYIAKVAPDGYAVVTTKADESITAQEFWDLLGSGEEITIGTSSIGGHAYVEMAYVLMDLGTLDKIKFVVYDGSNSIMQAIQNGEVRFGLLDDTYIAGYHAAGEIKGLMVLGPNRDPLVPDVSCVGDFKDIPFLGDLIGVKLLVVRADTPEEIVEYIKQQVNEVILSDAYQEYLVTSQSGTLDRIWTEDELNEWIVNATQAWDSVLIAAGLK